MPTSKYTIQSVKEQVFDDGQSGRATLAGTWQYDLSHGLSVLPTEQQAPHMRQYRCDPFKLLVSCSAYALHTKIDDLKACRRIDCVCCANLVKINHPDTHILRFN